MEMKVCSSCGQRHYLPYLGVIKLCPEVDEDTCRFCKQSDPGFSGFEET